MSFLLQATMLFNRIAGSKLAKRLTVAGLALLGCLALTGCLTLPTPVAAELDPAAPGESNPFSRRLVPPAEMPAPAAIAEAKKRETNPHPVPVLSDLPLASGMIVLTDTTGPYGFFTSLMAAEYLPWTHAGIIALEADGPVVYDTEADVYPISGLSPGTFYSGGVRRQPFARYVAGSRRLVGIYALPPGVDAAKVVAFVRGHYERGTPFDVYFNAEDASALYCSELVALALEAGGAPKIKPIPMRENRSYAVIREWLQMHAPGLIVPGQFADPARLVARWYQGLSPAQIDAHFEIRRELLRRLDANIRIGTLLGWEDFTLFLRDDVRNFAEEILGSFETFEGDTVSIRREVQRRADLYFAGTAAGTTAAVSNENP